MTKMNSKNARAPLFRRRRRRDVCEVSDHGAHSLQSHFLRPEKQRRSRRRREGGGGGREQEEGQGAVMQRERGEGETEFCAMHNTAVFNGRAIPNLKAAGGISHFALAEGAARGY